MIKIKFHSVVDYITNSSTEIYSSYSASPKACKEMVDEILKALGITDKTCDDMFRISVGVDYWIYSEYVDNNDLHLTDYPEDWKEQEKYVKNLMELVEKGEIEKPQWMKDAELETNSNEFLIMAKSPEYEVVAKKIDNFLNSVSIKAEYDG